MAAVQQKSVMKFEARLGVKCEYDTRKCGQLCSGQSGPARHARSAPRSEHRGSGSGAPLPVWRVGGGRGEKAELGHKLCRPAQPSPAAHRGEILTKKVKFN